jgi:hypothetical protein
MNLKLIWACYDLYRKVKQVPKEAFMDLGWKTITGAILVGLGYAAKTLVGVLPELEQVGDGLIALGAVIGGIGVRVAIKKSGPVS